MMKVKRKDSNVAISHKETNTKLEQHGTVISGKTLKRKKNYSVSAVAYVKEGNTCKNHINDLPYSLPDMHELGEEKDILVSVSERTIKIRQKMLKDDLQAIGEDWANVGRDLSEAIRKAGNRFRT